MTMIVWRKYESSNYTSGEMLTGELKKLAIEEVTRVIMEMQERRKNVTDETLDEFLKIRRLKYKY
ncbi:hypothetical protein COOONC_06137 [Cooperia oncophora]